MVFFMATRNSGKMGNCLGSFFELDGVAPLPFSRVATKGLFLGAGWIIGLILGLTAQLDLEVLHTKSSV